MPTVSRKHSTQNAFCVHINQFLDMKSADSKNYKTNIPSYPGLTLIDVLRYPLLLNPAQFGKALHSSMSSSTVHLRAVPVSSLHTTRLILF